MTRSIKIEINRKTIESMQSVIKSILLFYFFYCCEWQIHIKDKKGIDELSITNDIKNYTRTFDNNIKRFFYKNVYFTRAKCLVKFKNILRPPSRTQSFGWFKSLNSLFEVNITHTN